MGNRAVITTTNARREDGSFKKNEIGIYLHWHGSPEDVQRFLDIAKAKGVRKPEDDCYGWARLCQVIGEDIGGYELSIGIDRLERLDCDNYDNGVYIFKDWTIVKQIDSSDVKVR
jgi:hypothetical protein